MSDLRVYIDDRKKRDPEFAENYDKGMQNVIVNTGTTTEYFERLRETAKQIDRGEVPEPEFAFTFEDPDDMLAVMTPARLELFRATKSDPL